MNDPLMTPPSASPDDLATSGENLSLRERMRIYGRQAVILEEMLRLGFWPPNSEAVQQREVALAEIQRYEAELLTLRRELRHVEGAIDAATNVEKLIAEIRARRIERVRAERERRRVEKAQQLEERRRAEQARRRERPPFLGQGVSAGLRYEGGDDVRVRTLGLPPLATASDIAAAIGIEESALAWLSYHRGAATVDHYHRFAIPKRNGGTRIISSPKGRLRVAQTWVLHTILSRVALHDAAMAFRQQRSIKANAALHYGRAIVVRIDLKDFFPSIGFRRVKGLFESFGYNEGVSTILALLCTEAPRVALTLTDPTDATGDERRYVAIGERVLPQGACTSPAITNILCRALDARLAGLARHFGYTYSRYADDLVFSHTDHTAQLGAFLIYVRQIVRAEGLTINEEKTRVMRSHQRQTVTGLVVNRTQATPREEQGSTPTTTPAMMSQLPDTGNGAVRLSRRDLRRFRALVHHCESEGFDAVSARLGRNARTYARGYYAYIHMVSPSTAERLAVRHPWLR